MDEVSPVASPTYINDGENENKNEGEDYLKEDSFRED